MAMSNGTDVAMHAAGFEDRCVPDLLPIHPAILQLLEDQPHPERTVRERLSEFIRNLIIRIAGLVVMTDTHAVLLANSVDGADGTSIAGDSLTDQRQFTRQTQRQ